MWPEQIDRLDGLREVLVGALTIDDDGPAFFGVRLGTVLADAPALLGPAKYSNLESGQQQMLTYTAPLRPHAEDPNRIAKLEATLVAYNDGPLQAIRMVESFSNYGPHAEDHRSFRRALIGDLVTSLGKPTSKTLRRGREAVRFDAAGLSIRVWHSDHLYVQLM